MIDSDFTVFCRFVEVVQKEPIDLLLDIGEWNEHGNICFEWQLKWFQLLLARLSAFDCENLFLGPSQKIRFIFLLHFLDPDHSTLLAPNMGSGIKT